MKVTLTVRDGPRAGRSASFLPGQVGQVGRSGWADLALTDAPALADLHFALECGRAGCTLRDLGAPGGTLVNGSRVARVQVRDGDQIEAGGIVFLVRIEASSSAGGPAPAPAAGGSRGALAPTPEAAGPRPAEARRDLLDVLAGRANGLFAVLDAAREPAIPLRLSLSGAPFQSLYEGEPAAELAPFAPYLVALDAGSPLLELLVHEGWGKSWGVFLHCGRPFEEVRKQLRRFLIVQDEGGKSLYFRFYDPRVLRIFLPTCTAGEASEFFGPIEAYLCEADGPGTLLRFSAGAAGVRRESVELADRAPRAQDATSASRG
jgi:hypothetical protein